MTKVEQALKALISPDELGDGEQVSTLSNSVIAIGSRRPWRTRFFADRRRRRRRRGVGVGMDEAGNIVYATPPGPAAS